MNQQHHTVFIICHINYGTLTFDTEKDKFSFDPYQEIFSIKDIPNVQIFDSKEDAQKLIEIFLTQIDPDYKLKNEDFQIIAQPYELLPARYQERQTEDDHNQRRNA